MSLNIQLQKFEGPLALLLYLIRKEEMDIMDINVHEITKQYLEYIRIMKELDLEMAGEFIAMASTLIHIKSRMLLPQYDANGEIIEQEDPRKELVQKLLEYQKYQEAARSLYERPLVGRDIWLRGIREEIKTDEEEIVLEDNGLFSLISAYRKLLRSVKKRIHNVSAKTQSIASRILELRDRLVMGVRVTMNELIVSTENQSRQILITFLSLLELGKMGFVNLYQSDVHSDIWIDLKKPIETDVISRVEEYDNLHAEEKATQLMEETETLLSLDEVEDLNNTPSEIQNDSEAASDSESASDDEIFAAEKELNIENEEGEGFHV